jgi:uncharacterized membrane protein YagU involved in acid resistance
MEKNNAQPPIFDKVKEFIQTKVKLLKYEGIDKASSIIAEMIADMVVVTLLIITFVFFSVTLALSAAHLLASYWEGFGCVTLLYGIIAALAHLLKVPIRDKLIGLLIRKIFKQRPYTTNSITKDHE